jgi:hypothetical protein
MTAINNELNKDDEFYLTIENFIKFIDEDDIPPVSREDIYPFAIYLIFRTAGLTLSDLIHNNIGKRVQNRFSSDIGSVYAGLFELEEKGFIRILKTI